MGESKRTSVDEVPSGNKPIEGLPGEGPEMPVVVVIVLAVVSAIGSGFGLMRARKARAARQRGAGQAGVVIVQPPADLV